MNDYGAEHDGADRYRRFKGALPKSGHNRFVIARLWPRSDQRERLPRDAGSRRPGSAK